MSKEEVENELYNFDEPYLGLTLDQMRKKLEQLRKDFGYAPAKFPWPASPGPAASPQRIQEVVDFIKATKSAPPQKPRRSVWLMSKEDVEAELDKLEESYEGLTLDSMRKKLERLRKDFVAGGGNRRRRISRRKY
jgi:hypothetical protein